MTFPRSVVSDLLDTEGPTSIPAPPGRPLLAALSRSLPRVAWTGFPVKPETLLRWHRVGFANLSAAL
jgi:hypothetical protein